MTDARNKIGGLAILTSLSIVLILLFGTAPAVASPAQTEHGPIVTRSEFAPAPNPFWFQGCISPLGPRMNYVSADLVYTGINPIVLKLFHQNDKGSWVPVTSDTLRIMVNGYEKGPDIQLVGTMGTWDRRQAVSIMVWGVSPDEKFRLLAQYNDADNNPRTNFPVSMVKEWSARSVANSGCSAPA